MRQRGIEGSEGVPQLRQETLQKLFQVMWVFIVFVVLGVIGSMLGGSKEGTAVQQTTTITQEECKTIYTGINKDMDKFIQLDEISRSDDVAMLAVSNVLSDHENAKQIVKNINTIKRNITFYQENCEDKTGRIDTTEFYARFPD